MLISARYLVLFYAFEAGNITGSRMITDDDVTPIAIQQKKSNAGRSTLPLARHIDGDGTSQARRRFQCFLPRIRRCILEAAIRLTPPKFITIVFILTACRSFITARHICLGQESFNEKATRAHGTCRAKRRCVITSAITFIEILPLLTKLIRHYGMIERWASHSMLFYGLADDTPPAPRAYAAVSSFNRIYVDADARWGGHRARRRRFAFSARRYCFYQ